MFRLRREGRLSSTESCAQPSAMHIRQAAARTDSARAADNEDLLGCEGGHLKAGDAPGRSAHLYQVYGMCTCLTVKVHALRQQSSRLSQLRISAPRTITDIEVRLWPAGRRPAAAGTMAYDRPAHGPVRPTPARRCQHRERRCRARRASAPGCAIFRPRSTAESARGRSKLLSSMMPARRRHASQYFPVEAIIGLKRTTAR